MPAIVPLLVPILTATAAATTIGTGIYSLTNQPSGPDPNALAAQQTQAQNQQTQAQQTAAVQAAQRYAPNIQSALGGSVSPDYYTQTAAAATGGAQFLGPIQQALNMQGVSTNGQSSPYGVTSPNPSNPFQQANFMSQSNSGSIPDIMSLLQGQGGNFHGAS